MEGLAADNSDAKSLIPCLEPCAVLLEFARTAVRIEQRQVLSMSLASEEVETLAVALEHLLEEPCEIREADFSAADNSRRIQLLLEKIKPT